jgi:hypothetical protein
VQRGVKDFKKGYQPRTNIRKDEKGDLVADSYSILTGCTIYFSKLFHVGGVYDVRHTEFHTAEPLVPEPSAYELQLAIGKLKSHKSPGIKQIPSELFKARGRIIRPHICKLINSTCNKQKLPDEWKQSITVPMYMKGDKTYY